MSFGFFGIQFGWGLQMANMSAIYEYLGAKADEIPILAEALGVPPYAFFEDTTAAPSTAEAEDAVIGQLADAERQFIVGLVELLTRYREQLVGAPETPDNATGSLPAEEPRLEPKAAPQLV